MLDAGDHLLSADGAMIEVIGLDRTSRHSGQAFDLTVEGVHTFFVATDSSSALVHNCILPPPSVSNAKLQNSIDSLHRPNATVGNGTTMDAIRHEITTGELVGGRSHILKGQEMVNGLRRWIRENPGASRHDQFVAQSLLDDLLDALGPLAP